MRHLFLLPVVFALAAAAPAAAQSPSADRPVIERQARQRPMPARNPAAALLGAREALGLSADQVARLEALAAAQTRANPGNPGDMLRARADLMDAMKGEGDAAALRRAMDRAHQLRTERALATLKARQDARAILTADQRSRADALRQTRRMRGQGRVWGGRRGMAPGMRRGGAPRTP
jgi:Spy/CpxP family protein refolding chaperone